MFIFFSQEASPPSRWVENGLGLNKLSMQTSNKDIKEFTYGKAGCISTFLPLVMFSFATIIVLFGITENLFVVLFRIPFEPPITGTPWGDLLVFCLIGYAVIVVVMPMINICNKVQVLEKGLRVRIFTGLFYWKFIPWKDIIGIKPSPKLQFRLLFVWVIKVKHLTFLHRLLSETYRTGSQPGIIITSDMKGGEELLKIIQDHLPNKE